MPRPHRSIAVALSLGIALAARAAAAQAPTPAPDTALARVGTRADSLAELASLEAVVRHDTRDAAAWHRKGMLAWALLATGRKGGLMSQENVRLARNADSSLRMAARGTPPNSTYLLDAARYLRSSSTATLRVTAVRYADDAYRVAMQAHDVAAAAAARDFLGIQEWRKYEQFANRYDPKPGMPELTPQNLEAIASSTGAIREFLASSASRPPEGTITGELHLRDAQSAFADAAAADPSAERPRRHLYMALAERARWDELHALARANAQARPADAMPWLALGLAAHRLGMDLEAQAAFDSGLARLEPNERGRYTRLTRLLPPNASGRHYDSVTYAAADSATRAALDRAFWEANSPIALRTLNPHHLEFLSRVVYAELRWTVDDFGLHGADTDRGDIYVRYGPPEIIANLGSSSVGASGNAAGDDDMSKLSGGADGGAGMANAGGGGSEVGAGASSMGAVNFGVDAELWVYTVGASFLFSGPVGWNVTHLTGNFANEAEIQRVDTPVMWSTTKDADEPDTVTVQVARFRAPNDSLDLVVAGAIPFTPLLGELGRGSTSIDVGLTLMTPTAGLALRDSARVRMSRDSAAVAAPRVWRRRVGAGAYSYRVEGWGVVSGRGARAAATIAPRPTRGFGTSDVLLAASIAPPAAGEPKRWSDFTVVPNAGRFARGAPVAMLWESYALGAGPDSASHYRVTVTVERVSTGGVREFAARILGGAVAAVGRRASASEGRLSVSYDRQARAQPVQPEYLTLDVGDAPAGDYVLRVSVEDLVKHATAASSARFTVTP